MLLLHPWYKTRLVQASSTKILYKSAEKLILHDLTIAHIYHTQE